jgi:hypothetical protein
VFLLFLLLPLPLVAEVEAQAAAEEEEEEEAEEATEGKMPSGRKGETPSPRSPRRQLRVFCRVVFPLFSGTWSNPCGGRGFFFARGGRDG